jgi:endo-1,4-beta-xylanase
MSFTNRFLCSLCCLIILIVSCFHNPSFGSGSSSIKSVKIKQLRQKLEKDLNNAHIYTIRKMRNGEQWLAALETVQGNIKQVHSDGLSELIMIWNEFSRTKIPATLLSQSAILLRSELSRNAVNIKKLSELMPAAEKLAREVVYELEALDRIERYRRRDLEISVLDSNGKPVVGAKVYIDQIKHDFLFGCNIFTWEDNDTPHQQMYRQQFAELMNYATLGFYWSGYERKPGQTQRDRWMKVAQWCKEHDIQTKGHPLVWNYSDPAWLPNDPVKVHKLQLDRINREMSDFKGLVDWWDVVNEVTKFDRKSLKEKSPKLTKMWAEYGQLEFPRQCYIRARKIHPPAFLLINDYEMRTRGRAANNSSEQISKNKIYEDVIEALVDDAGKPLYDAIGIQSHMHGGAWSTGKILKTIERFAKYKVPLHFTETTIVSGPKKRETWQTTTQKGEQQQADEIERVYRTIFSRPEVEALTWWDFSDYHAWQGAPAGLLRKDNTPKLAYNCLKRLIKNDWFTQKVKRTAENGKVQFRGYLGDYMVQVKTSDGKRIVKKIQLLKDEQPKRITISIE